MGDLALMAIGQEVCRLLLQVARLTSAIVNGGYLTEPRLVSALRTKEGIVTKQFSEGKRTRVLNSFTAAQIRYMMLGVVEYGTGKTASSGQLLLGGKSGTAETGRLLNDRPEQYSWFTGFVATGGSQKVITVFIEEPPGKCSGTFWRYRPRD